MAATTLFFLSLCFALLCICYAVATECVCLRLKGAHQ